MGQDLEEEETYYYEVKNSTVVEGGFNYFIPLGDFKRNSPDNHLGLDVTILRQINYSRFFLGFNYSSRRLDMETVKNFEPQIDIQARTRNFNYSAIARFYPQIYLSIFEFFAEGGAGLNVIRTISRDYDKVAAEYFNQITLLSDFKVHLYGGGGFHVALDESWFLTSKVQSYIGPSMDFYARRKEPVNIVFPIDAFELTSAAYRATTISLSLTYIF